MSVISTFMRKDKSKVKPVRYISFIRLYIPLKEWCAFVMCECVYYCCFSFLELAQTNRKCRKKIHGR